MLEFKPDTHESEIFGEHEADEVGDEDELWKKGGKWEGSLNLETSAAQRARSLSDIRDRREIVLV